MGFHGIVLPMAGYKLQIVIPDDHHVELSLPAEVPAGPAEVIVFPGARAERHPRRDLMGMDRGKGWIAEDFDAPLPDDLQRLFEGLA